MTTEQLVLVVCGAIVNAGTFAAGILVGCSLRKGGTHDCDSNKEEVEEFRHHDCQCPL